MENSTLREIATLAIKAKELGHDVFVTFFGHTDTIYSTAYNGGYDKGEKLKFDGFDMCFVGVSNHKDMSRLATTLSELTSRSSYSDKTLEIGNLIADIYELARKLSVKNYHVFV